MITADGQLEAFEENIFLRFLLSKSEEFVVEGRASCCISIEPNLEDLF